MKTKKQKELIDSFFRTLDAEDKSVYRDIIVYLSELGYNPKKERSHISFKHSRHNKQIAKIGIRNKKELSHFFCAAIFRLQRLLTKICRNCSYQHWKISQQNPWLHRQLLRLLRRWTRHTYLQLYLPRRREKSPLRSQRTGNSEYLRRRFQRDQTAY